MRNLIKKKTKKNRKKFLSPFKISNQTKTKDICPFIRLLSGMSLRDYYQNNALAKRQRLLVFSLSGHWVTLGKGGDTIEVMSHADTAALL